jgi:hypothetical protein
MRNLALLTLVAVGCSSPSPQSAVPACDTAPFFHCAAGTVFHGGCGGPESPVGQCARGCAVEGQYTGDVGCALGLCLENTPKKSGDPCADASDCAPTKATWSGTAITNTHLACDAGSRTCVATAAPVVADWRKPCGSSVIAHNAGVTYGYANAVADPGCAEGWCALDHQAGVSCTASACTRPCSGDAQCPDDSVCVALESVRCDGPTKGYCAPAGLICP